MTRYTNRYVVTNTILSRREGATPADVTYYRGEDKTKAVAAVLQAATLDGADNALPEAMKFDVTSTRLDSYRIEVEEPEPDDTFLALSLEEEVDATSSIKPLYKTLAFDNETNVYSLSDCVWWDQPVARRPWWAKGDCSGRVGDSSLGVVCERHFNKANGNPS